MKFSLAVIVTLSALAFPAAASAGLASITFRSVSLDRDRTLAGSPGRFDLVGLRWHGSGSVEFSVRGLGGGYGPWLDATGGEDDRPDDGTPEAARMSGWRVGAPTWVGPSSGIRYRITGAVADLRASFVRSPELKIPLRAVSAAGSPPIVKRSSWGADEKIRRRDPSYAPSVRFASVHNTAGSNDYSPSQVAAIIRAIELFHVESNGWDDIGYNFLVDRYGRVYEGRYGGVDENVVGAHIRGFNQGSVGVAVIGSFGRSELPAAAQASLQRLIAWRLDLAHVDPLSTLIAVSDGSERYPKGTAVVLRTVSGHRDTGLTTCPGDRLYGRLETIASRAEQLGLPKIFSPDVSGDLEGRVRFRARVSSALPWTVRVTDLLGQDLAIGSGKGTEVDWTWDASLAGVSGVRWSIDVARATPAAGTLGKPEEPLAIEELVADPAMLTPNGDGLADVTKLSYTTTTQATVDVTLFDAGGSVLTAVVPQTLLPAGRHSLTFDGLDLPDGVYTLVVTAVGDTGVSVSRRVRITITRTLATASLSPAVFTPDGDGKRDELAVTFRLDAPASVRVRVLREGTWVATLFSGALDPGLQSVRWDGAKRSGRTVDGSYSAVVEATDAVGTVSLALPFLLDAQAPSIRLLSRPPRLWLSEAASLTIRVNGSRRRITARGRGTVPLRGIRSVRSIVVVARDAAGHRAVLQRP